MSGRSSLFAAVAGSRAKWIVFAVWVVVIFGVVRRRHPREVHGRPGERVDLVPARRRRVDQGADRGRGPAGRRARARGHPLPPRERADGGRQAEDRRRRRAPDVAAVPGRRRRRRDRRGRRAEPGQRGRRPRRRAGRPPAEGCGGPTTAIPGQPRGLRAVRRAGLLARTARPRCVLAYVRGDGESDTLLDPIAFWRDTVSDPGGGLEVKITGGAGYAADAIEVFENINGTLLLARDAARDLPADPDLPLADLPVHPAGAVIFAEFLSQTLGYGAGRGGRDDQRPVELDHVDPRARRGHGLRAADRRPLPRGDAPRRGQVRRRCAPR